MTSIGKNLDDIYRRLGGRGLTLALFSLALFLHVVFALRMNAPSFERGEYAVSMWGAYFAGFGGAENFLIFSDFPVNGAWLGGVLYAPFFYLVDDPVIRYRCMLVLNGVVASVIPVLVYSVTASLGLQKAWQKTLCAIAAGGGAAAFAYTKFIWTETFCVFFPIFLFFLFVKCGGIQKNSFLRFLLSILTAFALALAPAADERLWVLVLVFILTAIYSRFVLRVKTVAFSGFLPAFAIFSALMVYIGDFLNEQLGGLNAGITVFSGFSDFAFADFTRDFFSRLFYFTVSTWGIGVIGAFLCVAALYKNSRKKTKNADDKLFVSFAFFALAYNFLMLVISAPAAYGRYIDGAAPLILIFTICCVFLRGLEFKTLVYSSLISAAIFGLFFAYSAPRISARISEGQDSLFAVSSVHSLQGFSPARLGLGIDAPFTTENLLFTVSAVFCLIALLFVLVCCAERYRPHIIAFCFFLTVMFSGFHTALSYIPFEAARAERENSAARAVSEHVYNSAGAPPFYILSDNARELSELLPALRFMNRHALISSAASYDELPEDCFIITRPETLALLDDEVKILARTEELIIAALGEKSEAYAISQETVGSPRKN